MDDALYIILFFGVLFLPFFARMTFLRPKPKLADGETRKFSGVAVFIPNLLDREMDFLRFRTRTRYSFSVHGYLHLTSRRLVWLPFYPGFGSPYEISLRSVTWVEKGRRNGYFRSLIVGDARRDHQFWVSWSLATKIDREITTLIEVEDGNSPVLTRRPHHRR